MLAKVIAWGADPRRGDRAAGRRAVPDDRARRPDQHRVPARGPGRRRRARRPARHRPARTADPRRSTPRDPARSPRYVAAALGARTTTAPAPWRSDGWRLGDPRPVRYDVGGVEVVACSAPTVTVGDAAARAVVGDVGAGRGRDRRRRAPAARRVGRAGHVGGRGRARRSSSASAAASSGSPTSSPPARAAPRPWTREVRSPMPGTVVSVDVATGDDVVAGQVLLDDRGHEDGAPDRRALRRRRHALGPTGRAGGPRPSGRHHHSATAPTKGSGMSYGLTPEQQRLQRRGARLRRHRRRPRRLQVRHPARAAVRDHRPDGRDGAVRPARSRRSTAARAGTTSTSAWPSSSWRRVDQSSRVTLEAGVGLGRDAGVPQRHRGAEAGVAADARAAARRSRPSG